MQLISTELGNLEKILVAIAAAMIVGAVGTAVGYGAWHVIGGSKLKTKLKNCGE